MVLARSNALSIMLLRIAFFIGLVSGLPLAMGADFFLLGGGGGAGGDSKGGGNIYGGSSHTWDSGGWGVVKGDKEYGNGGGGGGGAYAGNGAYPDTLRGDTASNDGGGAGGGDGGGTRTTAQNGKNGAQLSDTSLVTGGAGGTPVRGGRGGAGGGSGGGRYEWSLSSSEFGGGSGGGGGASMYHELTNPDVRNLVIAGGGGGNTGSNVVGGAGVGGGGGGHAQLAAYVQERFHATGAVSVQGGDGGDGFDSVSNTPLPAKLPSGSGGGGGGGAAFDNQTKLMQVARDYVVKAGKGGTVNGQYGGGGGGGSALVRNTGSRVVVQGKWDILGGEGGGNVRGGAGGAATVRNINSNIEVGQTVSVLGGDGGSKVLGSTGNAGAGGAASWTGSGSNLKARAVVIQGGQTVSGRGGNAGMATANLTVGAGGLAVRSGGAGSGSASLEVNDTLRANTATISKNGGTVKAAIGTLAVDDRNTRLTLNDTAAADVAVDNIVFAGKSLTVNGTGDMTHKAIHVSKAGATFHSSRVVLGVDGQKWAFDIAGVNNGENMLTGDGANIQIVRSSDVDFYSSEKLGLSAGDRITLVKDAAASSDWAGQSYTISHGVTDYDFDVALANSGANKDLNAVLRKLRMNEEKAKNYLEGAAGRQALFDLVFEEGVPMAMAAASGPYGYEYEYAESKPIIFGAGSYGGMDFDTGSNVRVRQTNVMLGAAMNKRFGVGQLMYAPFLEGGWGSYRANNSSYSGDGDDHYYGGGVLGRATFADMFYVEGSARGGVVHNDFDADFGDPMRAKYDSSTWYMAGHVGTGLEFCYNPCNMISLYGMGIASHQAADTVTTDHGERLRLSSVDSLRSRVGLRHTHMFPDNTKVYVGGAWDQEYQGDVKGKVNGIKVDDFPSLTGATFMGEIGAQWSDPVNGWEVDVAGRGYLGKREGVSGSVAVGKRF